MLDLVHVLPLLATRNADITALLGPVATVAGAKAAVAFRLVLQPSAVLAPPRPGTIWDFTLSLIHI